MDEIPVDPDNIEGVNTEGLQTPTEKEEVGLLFKKQVESSLAETTSEIVNLDTDRLFLNEYHSSATFGGSSRRYYRFSPSQEFPNFNFELTHNVMLDDSFERYQLTKFGRDAPRSFIMTSTDNQEESLTFEGMEEGRPSLEYYSRDFSGESLNSEYLSADYSSSGILVGLAPHIEGSGPDLFKQDSQQQPFSDLESLKAFAETGGNLIHQNFNWGRISYSEGKFEIILNDTNANPKYRIEVPESIDVRKVIDGTEIDKIYQKPDMPPEADEAWRNVSFSDLTGIKIEPIAQTSR